MARKIISTIFYILAGCVVYVLTMVAFLDIPIKLLIMGIICVSVVVFMLAGAAVNRFRRWKTAFGAVLLSGDAVTAFLALTFACMLLSEEARSMLPNKPMEYMDDYVAGFSLMAIVACAGILLIKLENQPAADAPQGGATVEGEK